jgi:hypothetical protein
VNASEEFELFEWNLLRWNTQFLLQFSLSSAQDAEVLSFFQLRFNVEWVRANGVGPVERESDFLFRSLLEEQSSRRVEEENTECTVEQSLVNVHVQMAFIRKEKKRG